MENEILEVKKIIQFQTSILSSALELGSSFNLNFISSSIL